MPLLRRQPFEHEKPPPDLQPEDEVFYCDITNEIFTDYEAFFERIILCNSLVWSCTITGRSGLTYQEAIDCEKKATRNLETFPTTLQKPLLFLASCTHRGRLADMNDDVFIFGKDRFFKGETVDVFLGGTKKNCKILDVIAPGGKEKENKPDENVIVIDDSDDDASPPKEQFQTLHPKQYKYVVQIVGKKSTQSVRPNKISRKKGLFTRDKVKLFLKHHSDPEDGIWKLKDDVVKKFQMSNYKFQDFFSGPLPAFVMTESKKKKKPSPNLSHPVSGSDSSMSHTPKYKDEKKKKKEKVSPPQAQPVVPELTPEEREALREKYRLEKLEEKMVKKEELRKKMEEERIKRKLERDKERERQKEEKRLQVEMMKEWSRPREDLECDDLKMLPEALPVNVKLPGELFGDALMVLEFVHNFKHMLDIKQFFSSKFTFEILENALMGTDVDSHMSELIQMMLIAIFTLQLEEEEEESEAEKQRKKDGPNVEIPDIDEDMLTSDISTNQLIQTATAASSIPLLTHGSSLRRMQVDSYVLTELVRLHLLASGAKTNAKDAKWRYQQRGGYTPLDDPGLELRRQDPVIIKTLATDNIFDLTPGAKLKLVLTLINQFLTYATSRDYLEDNYEKLRQVRMDLKQQQWAEVRREKEASAARYKRRMEERAKIREKQNEIRLQKIKEREEQMKIDAAGGDQKNSDSVVKQVNGINGDTSPVVAASNTPPKIDDCPTLEEIAAREEKEKEEEAVKKEEFQVEEKKLLDNILALQHGNAVYPLGRDRLFRKYWIFRGLPGLYIEDNDETITEETLMSLACVNEGYRKSASNSLHGKGGCSKENGTVNIPNGLDATSQDSKQSAGSDCIVISDSDSLADPDKKDDEDMMEDEPPEYNMVAVEHIKNRTFSHWSVIRTESQFQDLLDSLNVRGHREGPLKQALLEQRSLILDSVKKCPIYLLNAEAATEEEKEMAIKKTTGRWASKAVLPTESKFPTAQDELEHNLRENLLDTEERIFGGTLGHLKVEDRFAWRTAIYNGSYDPQTNDPMFAKSENTAKMELDDEDDDDDMSTQGSVTEESSVKDLNKALIQIGRCVDPRYLNVPLGEKESAKKARLKKEAKEQELKQKKKEIDDDNTEDEEKPEVKSEKKTAYERWEDSLLYATSFSQVFLHLMTLEKSIAWSKSALHARCKICRRKGEPDKMLLCDSCDRGHHMYCLKPPLEKVPMGEWFCPSCRPKEIKRSPRKERRRTFSQEEEEEEEEEEEGSDEDDSGEGEYNEDSSEAEAEEEESDNDNENICAVCSESGVLICCDGCPLSYHLHCAKPVLKKVPKVKWMCQKCTGYEKKGKIKLVKGGRKPKTTPKSQRSTPNSSQAGSRHASPVTVSKGSRKRRNSQSDSETPKSSRTSRKTGRQSFDPDNDSKDGKKHYTSTSRCNPKVQDMKVCEDIVLELLKHDDVWPFLKPVSKRLVPDYFDIVKKPMDFSTVKNKMNKYQYTDVANLIADVRQIFSNCDAYNHRKTDEFKAGATLSKLFEKRLKDSGVQDSCGPSGNKKSKKS